MPAPTRWPDRMFPRLDAAQLARLYPVGRRRRLGAGEVIYDRGSAKRAFYVLRSARSTNRACREWSRWATCVRAV